MNRAVLLHGTDASPNQGWLLWLKYQLEVRGYAVWAPELPNNHTPNRRVYNDFLCNSDWDFTDNLVIGHSSGAVSVLNLLADNRCPPIATAVLVSVWSDTEKAKLDQDGLSRQQFINLFPSEGFDLRLIQQKAGRRLFIHGDDDPYCPIDQAEGLAKQTASELIVISHGGHLGSQFSELPELTQGLEKRGWL